MLANRRNPLKIGITGHQEREGIDWSWVRSMIDSFLDGKPDLNGFSSLAAGTDQLFGDAVLASGGKLTAVIPIEDYETHFDNDSLGRYLKLLSASEVIKLDSDEPEERAFLAAGKWITRETDCLIAVWDGEPAEGTGGTGDIVAYALSLGRTIFHIEPIKQVTREL